MKLVATLQRQRKHAALEAAVSKLPAEYTDAFTRILMPVSDKRQYKTCVSGVVRALVPARERAVATDRAVVIGPASLRVYARGVKRADILWLDDFLGRVAAERKESPSRHRRPRSAVIPEMLDLYPDEFEFVFCMLTRKTHHLAIRLQRLRSLIKKINK